MASSSDKLRKYAPLWSVLIGGGLALTKSLTTRYLLKREVDFKWKDALLAFGASTASYLVFRMRHGEVKDEWYKR